LVHAETVAREFHDRGFAILRGFFSGAKISSLLEEASVLESDSRGIASRRNLRCRYMAHHATGELLLECFDPVVDIAPEMGQAATCNPLMALLHAIYACPGYLFKDKLILKPPGALGYPLHQDYIAWPGFPKSFLTVVIPLDAATEENGCTVVYPGYHRAGLMTPADGEFHVIPRSLVNEKNRVPLELAPGDIALFDGFTPHESRPNASSSARRQLYLSYNSQSDGGDCRAAHYHQFHEWLQTKYPRPANEPWFFA
jgi:2-aminoethylphosphonate dioxygenase